MRPRDDAAAIRRRGIARVDVDPDQLGIADHERRLAERAELRLDRLDVEPGPVEQEFGAVPPSVLRSGHRGGAPARRPPTPSPGSRPASAGSRSGGSPVRRTMAGVADGAPGCVSAHRPGEALEDDGEAEAAGVDDVGVTEHLELVDGSLDRGVGLGDEPVEDDPDVVGLPGCRRPQPPPRRGPR